MNRRNALSNALLISLCSNAYSGESNWTGNVKQVIARDTGVVSVIVDAPRSPNPSDATFNCQSGVVYLASTTSAPPNSMVSVALTAYSTQKEIRIGINGTGSTCVADYIVNR